MAKRLKPLDRYMRVCAFCGGPFVQKDPEQVFCCPAHNRRWRESQRDAKDELTKAESPGLILTVAEFLNRQEVLKDMDNFDPFLDPSEEPEGLSGIELLAWRNEHRKTPDNE